MSHWGHQMETLGCRQFTGVWNIPTRCSGSAQMLLNHSFDMRPSENREICTSVSVFPKTVSK